MSRSAVACPACRRRLGWTRRPDPGKEPRIHIASGVHAEVLPGGVLLRCKCGGGLIWRGSVAWHWGNASIR